MKRQCPICFIEARLVKHHWWEDNSHMVGHLRMICRNCNGLLRTLSDENNHVLPEWAKQIEFVRSNIGQVYLSMRVRTETKEKLDYLKQTNPDKSWDMLLEPVINFGDKPPKIPIIVHYPAPEGLPDLTRLD